MSELRCDDCEELFAFADIRIIEFSNDESHIDEYLVCKKCDRTLIR